MSLFHASKDIFRRTQLMAQAQQIERELVTLKKALVEHEATLKKCQDHLDDLKDLREQMRLKASSLTDEQRAALRDTEAEIQQLENYLATERPDQQLLQYRRRFQTLFKRLQALYQKLPGKKQLREEDL